MRKHFLLALLLLILSGLPASAALDQITITYDQAQIGDNYRFWYGQGEFISDIEGKFAFDTGNADIITYSSGVRPLGVKDSLIYFTTENDSFEALFLAPQPEGHGLYQIELILPEINPEKDIMIRIENAEWIINSNVDFSTSKDGKYLELKATTSQQDIKITYSTKLTSMLVSDMLAASTFAFFLFGYIVYKRRDIRSGIQLNLKDLKTITGIKIKESEKDYEISLDTKALNLEKTLGRKEGKIYLKIPFWLVSALVLGVLMWAFYRSITNPLVQIWNMLGVFKVFIIAFSIVLSLLSAVLIVSVRSNRDAAFRFALIGGSIIGIMFAYLGLISVILSITTILLIYLLSMIVLEEEEEEAMEA